MARFPNIGIGLLKLVRGVKDVGSGKILTAAQVGLLSDLSEAQIAALATLSAAEQGFLDGITAGTPTAAKALVLDAGSRIAGGGPVVARAGAVAEEGAGTYTVTIPIPAGSLLLGIDFGNVTNWNGDAAALNLGYTGALTAYINALNVKTTSPAAAGPYAVGAFFAAATDLICTVVATGAGTAGNCSICATMVPATGAQVTTVLT